mmetsp:Transcript_43255/g.85336  ORF Transcript_43255/g.85336 Transcript_43255/m.85336 type:complete len:265 (-) Transcript_43255:337-1131(-)
MRFGHLCQHQRAPNLHPFSPFWPDDELASLRRSCRQQSLSPSFECGHRLFFILLLLAASLYFSCYRCLLLFPRCCRCCVGLGCHQRSHGLGRLQVIRKRHRRHHSRPHTTPSCGRARGGSRRRKRSRTARQGKHEVCLAAALGSQHQRVHRTRSSKHLKRCLRCRRCRSQRRRRRSQWHRRRRRPWRVRQLVLLPLRWLSLHLFSGASPDARCALLSRLQRWKVPQPVACVNAPATTTVIHASVAVVLIAVAAVVPALDFKREQ